MKNHKIYKNNNSQQENTDDRNNYTDRSNKNYNRNRNNLWCEVCSMVNHNTEVCYFVEQEKKLNQNKSRRNLEYGNIFVIIIKMVVIVAKVVKVVMTIRMIIKETIILTFSNYIHSNFDLKIIPFDREKNSGFNHIRIISFTVT